MLRVNTCSTGGDVRGLARPFNAYAFVATKADKLKRSQLAQQLAKIRKAVTPAIVLPTSSESGAGVDVVWKWIRAAIETEPEEVVLAAPDTDAGE